MEMKASYIVDHGATVDRHVSAPQDHISVPLGRLICFQKSNHVLKVMTVYNRVTDRGSQGAHFNHAPVYLVRTQEVHNTAKE